MIRKKDARRIKGKGKKKRKEKNACKAAGIDNSQEKHARAKVRKTESKAEIKGTERKREEEIKRAVKKRLGDEERIGGTILHIPTSFHGGSSSGQELRTGRKVGEKSGEKRSRGEEGEGGGQRDCPSESP